MKRSNEVTLSENNARKTLADFQGLPLDNFLGLNAQIARVRPHQVARNRFTPICYLLSHVIDLLTAQFLSALELC